MTDTVKHDAQAAMKARDDVRLRTLRSAMAAFTNELVATGRKPTENLSDDEAYAVLKRLAKQRREASEQFEAGSRTDLADREKEELAVLEEYLPAQAPREDIERIARTKMEEMGITDKNKMGHLMGAIMKELGGNADGNEVRQVVESLLN